MVRGGSPEIEIVAGVGQKEEYLLKVLSAANYDTIALQAEAGIHDQIGYKYSKV